MIIIETHIDLYTGEGETPPTHQNTAKAKDNDEVDVQYMNHNSWFSSSIQARTIWCYKTVVNFRL